MTASGNIFSAQCLLVELQSPFVEAAKKVATKREMGVYISFVFDIIQGLGFGQLSLTFGTFAWLLARSFNCRSFIVLRHGSLWISRITYVVTTQRLC